MVGLITSENIEGSNGFLINFILASSGVLLSLILLQFLQQVVKFIQVFPPPLDFGNIWSIVKFFEVPQ